MQKQNYGKLCQVSCKAKTLILKTNSQKQIPSRIEKFSIPIVNFKTLKKACRNKNIEPTTLISKLKLCLLLSSQLYQFESDSHRSCSLVRCIFCISKAVVFLFRGYFWFLLPSKKSWLLGKMKYCVLSWGGSIRFSLNKETIRPKAEPINIYQKGKHN